MRCYWCHEYFKTTEHCRRHIKNMHKDKKRICCLQCDKRFISLTEFRLHFASYHLTSNYKLLNGKKDISVKKEYVKIDREPMSTSSPRCSCTKSQYESDCNEASSSNDVHEREIKNEKLLQKSVADEQYKETLTSNPLMCPMCQSVRVSAFDLGQHILAVHAYVPRGEGEQCYGCYHWFQRGLNLLQHMHQCPHLKCMKMK